MAKYLDLELGKRFKSFSLGNKKKVGLIHAIMHRPKLLLMDEPTSGLDPLIQQKFQQIIQQMAKRNWGFSFKPRFDRSRVDLRSHYYDQARQNNLARHYQKHPE